MGRTESSGIHLSSAIGLRVGSVLLLCLGALACALSPQQIFERSAPSVVRIEAQRIDGNVVGTGFAISDRYIATNLHVIDAASTAFVQLGNGSRFVIRRVIAYDESKDLAIVETAASGLRALRFGDSEALEQGERVYAIGNPLGLDYTITEGLFSGRRRLGETRSIELLQVSADLAQGSSGGPLLNTRGQVVGVATRVFVNGSYGLVVPIEALAGLRETRGAEQTFSDFAEVRFDRLRQLAARQQSVRPRQIPNHPAEFFSACARPDVEKIRDALRAAIESGAPVYNEGDHESCFRIYEGTALRLSRDLAPVCGTAGKALDDGLVRADGMESYDDKAWALRDAFDGLLFAIQRVYPEPR